MKRCYYFLILAIVVPTISPCQEPHDIHWYEHYFKAEQLQHIKYNVNNHEYSERNLDEFVDTLADLLLKSSLPDRNSRLPFYFWDDKMKYIVNSIDSLKQTKEEYFSPLGKLIRDTIFSIKNIGEREYALTHLQIHFEAIDSDVEKDILNIKMDHGSERTLRDYAAGKIPIGQIATACEADGDIMKRYGKLKEGLYLYQTAKYIYDSLQDYYKLGGIENKIASLYESKHYSNSLNRAIEHFNSAAEYFYKINDKK